jgi:hypothetical protein
MKNSICLTVSLYFVLSFRRGKYIRLFVSGNNTDISYINQSINHSKFGDRLEVLFG